MNIVIGIVVAILALIVGFVFLDASQVKYGRAPIDSATGEYGRLTARLKDLENPYSGIDLTDCASMKIGYGIAFLVFFGIFQFTIMFDLTVAQILLIALISLVLVSVLATKLVFAYEKRKVKRKIAEWIEAHPDHKKRTS